MLQQFQEGGVMMFPILVLGIILLAAAIRYAIDAEPVRLRFVGALVVALLVMACFATLMGVAAVLGWAVEAMPTTPEAEFARTLTVGFMECTRCGLLAGLFLTLALIAVAIGAYRAGRRELKALRP